jgi:transcriptional regulator with XRE-family HTH domain
MSSANKLIDKWMKVCSIKTQTEAARRLGKSGSATLSNWRSGYAKPDDESIALMCEQCGEDAAQWIGKLHLEFEESPRLRKVWLRLAQAAAVMAGAFLLLGHGLDVHGAASFALSPLYIMRNWHWCLSSPSRRVPQSGV